MEKNKKNLNSEIANPVYKVKRKEGKLEFFRNGSYKYTPSQEYQAFKKKQTEIIVALKTRNQVSTVLNHLSTFDTPLSFDLKKLANII